MRVSYDKLWRLMKTNKMNKCDLVQVAELSLIGRLSKEEYVSLEVIAKLCKVLRCPIEDIVEILKIDYVKRWQTA